MGTKKGFILAAGYGTRMGTIGRKLPKVLWPIFEKSILELQILYLKELGVEDIFINTHHLSNCIVNFIKQKHLNVSLLHEKNLLGTGGCFHNFKKKVGDEKILAINGDQFYFCPLLENWYNLEGVTLFGVEIYDGDYKELEIQNGRLLSINDPNRKQKFITFSGVSVVDLKILRYKEGVSHYFSHVANYQQEKVFVKSCSKSVYYDFGGLEHYVGSLKRILKQYSDGKIDAFIEFLKRHNALDCSKLGPSSYGSSRDGEIVLREDFVIIEELVRYQNIVDTLSAQ